MRKTGRKVLAYGLAVAMMMSVSPVSAAAKPTLNAKTKTIAVGDKTTLSVKNTTKKATYKWTSANKKVATVTKSGVVTGQKAGTTTVTCTVKQGTQSTKLTAKITVLKVKNGGTKTVTAGETATLKVTQYKGAKYTWRSTDTSIVTVNSKGVVTGQKAGTAVVRVRVNAPETRYVAKYTIKVNTEKKVVNQTQLNKALKNKKLTSVVIDTKKAVDLTIPAGDYKNTSLTVNTPNGEITNNGIFKLIRIKMIKPNTWYEKASGNRIAVTADNAHIVVDKDATVASMSFDKKGSNVSVQVDGHVESMRTTKANTVDVTANGKVDNFKIGAPATVSLKGSTKDAINVTVVKKGEGSDVTSSVKVNVETPVTLALHLQEGAEGSSVNVTEKEANVSVENKTSEPIKITTTDGEKSVGAGETSTSQEAQPSNPGTVNTGGGSTPSTSDDADYVQVLDKVTVTPSITSANIGDTVTFTVKASDEFGDQIVLTEKNINWTVSGSSIKVISGTSLIVTTEQEGPLEVTATVTVDQKTVSSTATVNVQAEGNQGRPDNGNQDNPDNDNQDNPDNDNQDDPDNDNQGIQNTRPVISLSSNGTVVDSTSSADLTVISGSTITFGITGSSIQLNKDAIINWTGSISGSSIAVSGSSIAVSGSSIAVSGSSFTVIGNLDTFNVTVQDSCKLTVELKVTINNTDFYNTKTIVVK